VALSADGRVVRDHDRGQRRLVAVEQQPPPGRDDSYNGRDPPAVRHQPRWRGPDPKLDGVIDPEQFRTGEKGLPSARRPPDPPPARPPPAPPGPLLPGGLCPAPPADRPACAAPGAFRGLPRGSFGCCWHSPAPLPRP